MSITITTWNVQNLGRSDPVFADKLNFLVGTLQALGSDVVALQEILDPNALQEFANRLGQDPRLRYFRYPEITVRAACLSGDRLSGAAPSPMAVGEILEVPR